MLLSIKEMEVRKLPFAETWQPGEIDFADPAITQIAPLKTQGVAELLPHTGGEVRIKGRVSTDLQVACDRCLGPAKLAIDSPFDLFYKPAAEAPSGEEEIAIDEGEAEMAFYELPGLVLEDILREQVLLQIPMQTVCSESCKGICPVCGANRNETDCPHMTTEGAAHPADDRWSALKNIHIEQGR